MRIDLQPVELGRVQLHLAMEGGRVHIRMLVSDEAVQRMLEPHLETWRARFADLGVNVGRFDVRRDGNSPGHYHPAGSELSLQAIQADKNGAAHQRKSPSRLADSHALVDVMA